MTQPTAPPVGSGFTVTTQRQTRNLSGGGNFTEGYEVGFTTGNGAQGTVFIPMAQYNAQNVYNAIAARVLQLDEIGAIAAPPAAS